MTLFNVFETVFGWKNLAQAASNDLKLLGWSTRGLNLELGIVGESYGPSNMTLWPEDRKDGVEITFSEIEWGPPSENQ